MGELGELVYEHSETVEKRWEICQKEKLWVSNNEPFQQDNANQENQVGMKGLSVDFQADSFDVGSVIKVPRSVLVIVRDFIGEP